MHQIVCKQLCCIYKQNPKLTKTSFGQLVAIELKILPMNVVKQDEITSQVMFVEIEYFKR